MEDEMPDDEPLDDLQAVGLTAAASAARVAEVLARNAQEQRERQQRTAQQEVEPPPAVSSAETQERYEAAKRLRQEHDDALAKAKAWAGESNPRALEQWSYEQTWAESKDGRDSADRALLNTWTKAQESEAPESGTSKDEAPDYDSPGRRSITEQQLERAGVPAEAREARVKSDLMNGQDPQLAAAQGSSRKTQQRKTQPAPERVRGR